MKYKYLLASALIFFGFAVQSQTFSPPFEGYSRSKTTYITLKNGEEISCMVKKLFFKKGLIDELKIVTASDGKKIKINPEEISHMYIPPSALAKLTQKMDAATDLNKIRDNELSSEYLEDGYLYMESSKVQIKKNKVQDCMLQVLNPTFSKNIKVYYDPFAGETASIGVGGMKLAGGLAKSYYIKKDGEEVAQRIKKKEYKKDMEELFGECPDLIAKYGDNPNWSEFEKFIYDYSIMCN